MRPVERPSRRSGCCRVTRPIGATRDLFAVPVYALPIRHSFRNRMECILWPFNTKTVNRAPFLQGVASFQASYLATIPGGDTRASKQRGMQRPSGWATPNYHSLLHLDDLLLVD
jgi:hypothetical protein